MSGTTIRSSFAFSKGGKGSLCRCEHKAVHTVHLLGGDICLCCAKLNPGDRHGMS